MLDTTTHSKVNPFSTGMIAKEKNKEMLHICDYTNWYVGAYTIGTVLVQDITCVVNI